MSYNVISTRQGGGMKLLERIVNEVTRVPMLAINEIFGPTIQGEGKSAGKRVIFVRTSGCNLACIWCDTPYTWNWTGTKFAHPEKFDKKAEVKMMAVDEVRRKLLELDPFFSAVVISGGEPLLQKTSLQALVEILKLQRIWVEVETNGTVVPTPALFQFVDQFNVSPKLINSGPDNPTWKREVPEALYALAESKKSTFKFVVETDQDMEEILSLVNHYQMHDVYLMPQGRTKAEQEKRQEKVKEICAKYGFHFSPRLHILQYDTRRGV